MKQFWRDFWYGFTRIGPRVIYFIKTGRLHPEVEPYPEWPKYTIVGSVPGGGSNNPNWGSFTLTFNGQWRRYSHDLTVLEDSNPYTDWALQWANTE